VSVLFASFVVALVCGALLARLCRAGDESASTTFTRGVLGAVAAVVVAETLTGACGHLEPRVTLLALAVACLLLLVVASRVSNRERRSMSKPWTALEAALLAALLVALATRLWDALHRTTFLYDSLSYHLHAPATWLHDGRLSIVPAVFGDPAPAYAPANLELLFYFLMAPTRSAALAQAGQVPLLVLACAAVAATVREAGGARAAALAAALAFALVPEVWQQSTSSMTDVGAAAFLLAGLPFLLRLAREGRARDAGAFGLAVGLCAGSKIVGLLFVLPLVGAAAVFILSRARARALRVGGVALVAALATGAFWYARNLVVAGNPLYPLAVNVGGARLWPGVYDSAVLRTSEYHVARDDLAALGRLLLEPGVAFAVGGGLALALGARRRPGLPLLAAVLVGITWLAVPYQESRFLFAVWGVVAIAMADVGRFGAASVWAWAPLALGTLGSVLENPTAERGAVLAVGAAVLVVFVPARAFVSARGWFASSRWLVSGGAAFALLAFVLLARVASARPAPPFALGDELDDGWAWMRAHVHGARVAYSGNNLPFPLAGDDLSNDVRYVNVAGAAGDLLHDFARRATLAPAGPEPAPYREGARYELWLANLRATRREVLFVATLYPGVRRTMEHDADGFPVERAWADAHPESFTLRFAGAAARVYGVTP
jgi:4-amino-4-deoxy-L-arabinose transferase-like glycosyltransferase